MDLGAFLIDGTFNYTHTNEQSGNIKTSYIGNCGKFYYLTEFIAVPLEAHGHIIEETLADTLIE